MAINRLHINQGLLKKVAEGDGQAFETLFNHYSTKIYQIAFRLTESTVTSEEIVQDVFLKVWLQREKITEVEHFSAWLYTIARNYTFTVLKRMARQEMTTPVSDNYFELFHKDVEHNVDARNYEIMLQKAIQQLSPQQQTIYLAIENQGLTRDEIAARLNLSPETIKTHLAQARRNIRAFCLAWMGLPTVVIGIPAFY